MKGGGAGTMAKLSHAPWWHNEQHYAIAGALRRAARWTEVSRNGKPSAY